MKAISLFDLTGNMLKPWAEEGYECHIFDNQHKRGSHFKGGMYRHGYDLSQLPIALLELLGDVAFVSCFPPCTDLSVSGAKHMKNKGLRALQQAVGFFATSAEFCELSGAPYIIENPVSTMSTYWRKPDHTFHPWQYADLEPNDNYTKKTCLWTGGGFVMPMGLEQPIGKPDDRIHKATPGPDRANFRSATPMGFAKAVKSSNANTGDTP